MTLVYAAAAWTLGMLVAGQVRIPLPLIGVGVVWTLIIALLEGAHPRRRQVALLVLVAVLGAWRWQAAQPRITPDALAAHNDQGTVLFEGYVSSEPVIRQTRQQIEVTAEQLVLAGGHVPVRGAVLVTTSLYPHYRYGERLRLTGRLETPAILEGFDYREYLASQGIQSTLRGATLERLPGDGGGPLLRALYAAKSTLRLTIERILPHPEAGLLQGILLGLDHTLAEDVAEAFRIAGLTHIIVISGYNVSILLQAWFVAAGRLLHRWASLMAGMGLLVLFALFVGLTPPVVRAVITGCFFVLSQLAGRRAWPLASLAASALIMTGANPLLLHSVSYQLSMAATLSLILLQPRLAASLDGWLQGAVVSPNASWSRMLAEVLVATSAAQIMTLPILWAHFGEISPLALLANALVLPVQPLILLPGVLIALLGVPLPAVARVLGYLLWLPLHWSISVARWISTIPWATLALPRLSPSGAWLCYALLAMAILLLPLRGRRSSTASPVRSRSLALMAGSLCVVGLLWAAVSTLPDGRLHVYALDVGQGDALLLRTPQGHVILVDGGPDPILLATRLGEVLPFWERDIDLLLVTHDDSDHIGGLAPLMQRYRVAQVLRAGEPASGEASLALQDSLAAAGLSPQRVARGTEITLGECMLSVLHPGPRVVHNGPANNDESMVVRVQQGRFAMLLTGDIGETTESTLLAADLPLEAIALKVSHHGSSSTSTMGFLEAVTPQLALISVGQGNRYGHPDAAVIGRLQDAGALVLRTNQQGTLEVVTDGERVWVRTAR